MRSFVFLLTAMVLISGPLAGCDAWRGPDDYVARVGDSYLTNAEIESALEGLRIERGTTAARQQVIQQWIEDELLVQEARRRGLQNDSTVQQLLRANERSVMIQALTRKIYDEQTRAPERLNLRTYYEQHKESFRLREPYVRLLYLQTPDAETAQTARDTLAAQLAAQENVTDSTWHSLINRFASNRETALDLANNYYPVSHIEHSLNQPPPLAELEPGTLVDGGPVNGQPTIVYIIDRLPQGTIPALDTVRDQIAQQMMRRQRKRALGQYVQQLRSQAKADEQLEIVGEREQ